MRRRSFVALLLGGLAGCAGDIDYPVREDVVVRNEMATDREVTLTVDHDGTTLLDGWSDVASGDHHVYTGVVQEAGLYELTAALEDGVERTFTWKVASVDRWTRRDHEVGITIAGDDLEFEKQRGRDASNSPG